MSEPVDDAPITGRAETLGQLYSCVTHPAFRIGFLDAQNGLPLDHWRIMDRIASETPPNALNRLGFRVDSEPSSFFEDGPEKIGRTDLAQYRYEEGRRAVLEVGLKCKAWGHPDFPPAKVIDYILKRANGELEGMDK